MNFFNIRRRKGFTMIELMVVIAIAAIIFMIGVMQYRRMQRYKEFQTSFDNFVQQIRQAKTEAIAFGQNPSNYAASGPPPGALPTRTNYEIIVLKNFVDGSGTRRPSRTRNELKGYIRFVFTNVTPLSPMNFANYNTQFNGVAIVLAFRDTTGAYSSDTIIPFGPNGRPYNPLSSDGLFANDITIEMNLMEGANAVKISRVVIDRDTGEVTTSVIR